MNRINLAICVMVLGGASTAWATEPQRSPYAGQENREIKSLSAEDLSELRRGGGWGLAKAAEVNGYPGPAHLLEMKAQIGLGPEQVQAITAIYEAMKAKAISAGAKLIALEETLEQGFRRGTIDAASLEGILGEIADARRDLRFAHLAAHLEVRPILTSRQITDYNKLRGYDRAGPCGAVPAGHDAALWRRHHQCR
jgi:hypothetical protein